MQAGRRIHSAKQQVFEKMNSYFALKEVNCLKAREDRYGTTETVQIEALALHREIRNAQSGCGACFKGACKHKGALLLLELMIARWSCAEVPPAIPEEEDVIFVKEEKEIPNYPAHLFLDVIDLTQE